MDEKPITICFTYFKGLTLSNLEAALYSVRRQDLLKVERIVIVDNDSLDSLPYVQAAVNGQAFPMPVSVLSFKHGDASKTHSWSSNVAVRAARTPWILFTRADYLLDFDLLKRFVEIVAGRSQDWNGFLTGNVYHLNVDVGVCEQSDWRRLGPRVLRGYPGKEEDYTSIDSGVWMARRDAFEAVGGLDENLTAWGHAQTHFQDKLHRHGTEFVRVPEVMFYHPQHSAARDISVSHGQLAAIGGDLRAMWRRYEGVQPY